MKATPTVRPPVVLKTWQEVNAYYAKHLKPTRYGPKGQPIYDYHETMALNIIYPDDPVLEKQSQ